MKKLVFLVFPLLIFTSCRKDLITKPENTNSQDSIWHSFLIENNNIKILETKNTYYLSDDIVLSKEQFNILKNKDSGKSSQRSLVVSSLVKTWPEGKVYYEMNYNLTSTQISRINEAINWLSQNTSIQFIPASPQTPNLVRFTLYYQNNSNVGMKGGLQFINLTESASVSTVLHEIFHALGVFHEMGRSDRDDYINIHENNIYANKMHNFNKESVLASVNVGIFDPYSIMMYPEKTSDATFAKNTSEKILSGKNNISVYPSDYPTTKDLLGLDLLYNTNDRPYIKEDYQEEETYYDMYSGSFERQVTRTYSLFKDKAMSQPYTKPYKVPILIGYTFYETYNKTEYLPVISKEVLVIQPGTNSASITKIWSEDREFGDLVFKKYYEYYSLIDFPGYRRP